MPTSSYSFSIPSGNAAAVPGRPPAVNLRVPLMVESAASRQENGHHPHRFVGGLNGSTSSTAPADRQRLLSRAAEIDELARAAAERGELATAARKILEALDCERRAGGLGPQVLQLIKPRT